MPVVVVTPPAPIVGPNDLHGSPDGGDVLALSCIMAATEAIDGPDGWLGRALGPQTLELTLDGWMDCAGYISLPCPPVIAILSVKYDDVSGAEQTFPATGYGLFGRAGIALVAGARWPATVSTPGSVRIQYRAGYDGSTTGPVPERARQAVILGAQALRAAASREAALAAETVEGIGSRRFDLAGSQAAVDGIVERLLAGLRVYA